MRDERTFTYKSARSGSLLAGIMLVLVSEGIGIHLWAARKSLAVAFALTAMTLSAIVWLALDYIALGSGSLTLAGDALALKVGRRYNFDLPLAAISSAIAPTWRDIPERGMPEAADYINLMKQADPNVLVTLTSPLEIRMPGGRRRSLKRIGLHVDQPQELIAALAPQSAAEQNSKLVTPT